MLGLDRCFIGIAWLDELGNALGGIRTNYVDVPVARLSGLGQRGDSFCRIFGTTECLGEAELAELYPTEQDYVDAVTASVEASVAAGFLLQPDGDLIIADAQTSGRCRSQTEGRTSLAREHLEHHD